MAFVPTIFAKAGEENRTAYTAPEAVELIFAGWHSVGEGAPVDTVSARVRAAIEELEADLKGGVVAAGDTLAELYALILAGGGGGGGGPIDADDITDATAVGKSLLRAANAAAARAAISAITSGEAAALDSTLEATLTSLINARQAGDPDLTALAALSPTTNNMIQSVAGAWASRTPAQVKAALGILTSDVTGLDTALSGKAATSHTHTSSQVTDLTETVQDVVGAFLAAGTGITVNYDDAGNVATITAIGGGGSWDAEQTRDSIGAALIGAGLISVTVNDAGDTITISTTATANDTDANLKNRANHSGTQLSSTISDLTEAVQDVVGALLADGEGIDVTYNDAGNVETIALSGNVIVSHSFTGANSASVIPAPEVGSAGTTSTGSVAGIDANRMYFSTGVNNDYSMRTWETNKTDIVVEVTIPATDPTDWPGIAIRSGSHANDDNVYLVLTSGIWKHLAGVETSIASYGIFNAGDRIRAVAHGYSLKVYRKTATTPWALHGSVVLNGDLAANTKHGIAEYDADNTLTRYDDLWIGTITPAIEAELRIADAASKMDIDSGALAETIRDTIAAALVGGGSVTVTPNDGANTITISGVDTNTTDAEVVRDTIAAALVAGTNVTITPNDGADTITIAATGGGGLDTEAVQDLVATMILEGNGLTATYDDGAGTYTISSVPSILLNKAVDPLFLPDRRRLTVSEDIATVTFVASDAAYDRVYTRGTGGSPPAGWPIDQGPPTEYDVGGGYWAQLAPGYGGVRTFRFMADRDSVAFSSSVTAGNRFTVKVDGAPLSAAPFEFPSTGSLLTRIVFAGGHKTRLIEITGNFYNFAWSTKKPGRLWKPAPEDGPLIGVIGDSYTSPAVYNDAGTTLLSGLADVLGMYQRLGPLLGVRDPIVDGYGGTGYLADGLYIDYQRRLNGESPYASIATFAPDVLVVHGGGANDIFGGATDGQIITAATTLFQTARTLLPNAKLVFVEGFAPPGFTPGTYNPKYVTIRSGLQTPLAATGVYYIDVATTSPWISGAGNLTNNTDDTENSSIYVGGDDLHLSIAGHAYVANRLAGPLRRILRDRGALLNQLVA